MNRLAATLQLDLTLQFRNQLYTITAAVALILIVVVRQLIPAEALELVVPAMLFFSLPIYYFFAASMLLLEKGQRTLEGLSVTPLRPAEYLLSKTLSLTLLAVLESVAVAFFIYGPGANWLPLLAGIVVMAILNMLIGLAVVVRYESITDFLMPSVLYVMVLLIPAVAHFDLWDSPLLYLLPTQGAMLLLGAGFAPLAPWQLGVALLTSLVWIALFAAWCYRAYIHFIVRRGVS